MRICQLLGPLWVMLLIGCGSDVQPSANRATPATPSAPTSGGQSTTATQSSDPNSATPRNDRRESTGGDSERELRLNQLVFTIPEGWKRQAPASNFVMAEFTLPRAESDSADGRLTVSAAGGSIEANIERWREQFGGKPEQSSEDRIQVDGMDVVIVDLGGEFNDQRGPFGPANKQAGYRMLAAIIPVASETHFVKAVGPQATISAHAERIREFVRSANKN